jgi:hypothetical protein
MRWQDYLIGQLYTEETATTIGCSKTTIRRFPFWPFSSIYFSPPISSIVSILIRIRA